MRRTAANNFIGHLFKWPISRTLRGFRVYVLEPGTYDPAKHAEIFNAALTALSSSAPKLLDRFTKSVTAPASNLFDLVTFPEAFLPMADLTQALGSLSATLTSFGCVHVGLRPGVAEDLHLFKVDQLISLLKSISTIATVHQGDMKPIRSWLAAQSADSHFNVGCLFAIDANKKLRVCIHPKMVRSKYEVSPLQEKSMTEANVLTLVTLQPRDRAFLSVTLQPLLCSDALQESTDYPGRRPLDGVNLAAACFKQSPPDHVDIVSVATCTPQPEVNRAGLGTVRQWHEQFRSTFKRAGEGTTWARHNHCTFVLSNFRTLPRPGHANAYDPGGLSGVFVPVPQRQEVYPPYVVTSTYGRERGENGEDNTWSIPMNETDTKRSTLGYIAQIDPDKCAPQTAALMGFTITRFPRDTPRWKNESALSEFRVFTSFLEENEPKLTFQKVGTDGK